MLDEDYIRMQALAKQQTQQLYSSSHLQHKIAKASNSFNYQPLRGLPTGGLEEPEFEPLLLAAGEACSMAELDSPAGNSIKAKSRSKSKRRRSTLTTPKGRSPAFHGVAGGEGGGGNNNALKQFQYHPYNPNKENISDIDSNAAFPL